MPAKSAQEARHDCAAPYVIQVFTYYLSQPKELKSNKDLQAAFLAIGLAWLRKFSRIETYRQLITLPKEQMRQLLIV
ncbi:MAG: hypothetical protein U0V70_03090 [Terriglobia bacterium]